jgi:Predicted metal-sulfur cluster biosynthetic enzyme
MPWHIKRKNIKIKEMNDQEKVELEKNVVRALKQVYDPEIPVNIYDLGLIYEIKIDEQKKFLLK